jgi:hypothetical protein
MTERTSRYGETCAAGTDYSLREGEEDKRRCWSEHGGGVAIRPAMRYGGVGATANRSATWGTPAVMKSPRTQASESRLDDCVAITATDDSQAPRNQKLVSSCIVSCELSSWSRTAAYHMSRPCVHGGTILQGSSCGIGHTQN